MWRIPVRFVSNVLKYDIIICKNLKRVPRAIMWAGILYRYRNIYDHVKIYNLLECFENAVFLWYYYDYWNYLKNRLYHALGRYVFQYIVFKNIKLYTRKKFTSIPTARSRHNNIDIQLQRIYIVYIMHFVVTYFSCVAIDWPWKKNNL